MIPKILKLVFPFLFLSFLFVPISQTFSQQEPPCQTREECEQLLKKYEEEIKKYEENIQKTEKEKKTLQNQISLLKRKIEKLKLEIEQSNIMIRDVSLQIENTEKSIQKTREKIEDQKKKLAQILRTVYEADKKSLVEILLSEKTLSGFFDNLMYLGLLNSKTQELLGVVKNLKTSLEDQKMVLEEEKENLERILKMQILQKKESEDLKKEKEKLSKMTEAQYQKLLTEKKEIEKEAAKIRARIFELIGVSQAPTFGEAYELAKWIEKITGVRPAFLLAVLTQESNIGKNVGQCFLKDSKTGQGIKVSNGEKVERVMHPTRDIPHFLSITRELGRDPFNTLVSCPIPWVGGWGGAMGPAQFIPSTWIKYKERVKEITGSADPWNIKDSFVAAALYLADYGANKRTPEAERKAAMIYFSGTTNSRYSFYGNSVMAIASRYEEDIRILEQSVTFQKPKLFSLNFHPLFLQYHKNSF
jgi:membrane-bound lytic murein transglycosylase B